MVEWTFLAVELPSPAGSQTSNTSDQPDCLSLTRDLAAFLHKLPAGHVLDFKLDMSRVCASGLTLVLQIWLYCDISLWHVNDLALLLLKRIATD